LSPASRAARQAQRGLQIGGHRLLAGEARAEVGAPALDAVRPGKRAQLLLAAPGQDRA
jgi:hypothetical protein